MFRQRLRYFFTKEGFERFTSHHDLMRLFERALRRSGLPLKMSEGYNPRPQLSFPIALALGVESAEEIFEVELTRWVSPRTAMLAVGRQLQGGIAIKAVQSVAYGEKADVCGTEYSVKLAALEEDFETRLASFLKKESAIVERKTKSGTKSIDARKFVRSATLDGDTLVMSLGVSPAGSVRPEEVLEAILQGPTEAFAPLVIKRTRLDLTSPP